jgi:very-short-patch-repair endonuclease
MTSLGARSKYVLGMANDIPQPSPPRRKGRRRPEPTEEAAPSTLNSKRDIARKLRKNMTDAERMLWSLLRNRKLADCKFRRQVPIGPYIANFASFEARLIVEADDSQHADNPHDIQRDAWLAPQGYTVLRFWNADIASNPDGILTRITEHLNAHIQTEAHHE